MRHLLGGAQPPQWDWKIKGKPRSVNSFVDTIASEKKYIKSAAQFGLNNPRTYRDKYKLRKSVNSFERATGIKWPFKG